MVDDHHIPASVIQYNQLLKACGRCRPPLAREAERLFGELMALDASEQRRKFKTRDLRPTRITLKALNRCVGARRLAQLCEVRNGGFLWADGWPPFEDCLSRCKVSSCKRFLKVTWHFGMNQEKINVYVFVYIHAYLNYPDLRYSCTQILVVLQKIRLLCHPFHFLL